MKLASFQNLEIVLFRYLMIEAKGPSIKGRIHSIETCGTVDGPGIRFVIFTQGCPLKCLYCHNPDSRDRKGGREVSIDEIIEEVKKYSSYMQCSEGGVTVSGGEPLLQVKFVKEIFRRCRDLGIHTVLDTSGCIRLPSPSVQSLLDYVDLVLLDIKSYDASTFRHLTGMDVDNTLEFARYLHRIKKDAWIRFVLVPGLTDDPKNIEGLAKFICEIDNVKRIEILPFHKMGEYKWKMMGLDYKLHDTEPATTQDVERAKEIFCSYGLLDKFVC